jgi:hypothetical protein
VVVIKVCSKTWDICDLIKISTASSIKEFSDLTGSHYRRRMFSDAQKGMMRSNAEIDAAGIVSS